MTDKARMAAFGAMNNVRTAIDSAKRVGFSGNTVSSTLQHLSFACLGHLHLLAVDHRSIIMCQQIQSLLAGAPMYTMTCQKTAACIRHRLDERNLTWGVNFAGIKLWQ